MRDPDYLVPQKALRRVFRARFRELLEQLTTEHDLPAIDAAVWAKDWGVHLQPFGSGESAIKYLGAYVCRTAIGDSRIVGIHGDNVKFRWKDRANGNAGRTDTISGVEFVTRYLRHVLPRGMRAIRHYGYCHPAAKLKRERVAVHTGRPLFIGAFELIPPKPAPARKCPCCGAPMLRIMTIPAPWQSTRAPPPKKRCAA